LVTLLLFVSVTCAAQKKAKPQPKKEETPPAATQLPKLRDEYIKATKDYKASLQKLLALYQGSVKKVEQRHEQMQKLLAEGLVSKREVEDAESAVTDAKLKVTGVEQQMAGADIQIANVIMEIEGEKQLAKLGPMRRGSLVKTTSFMRFSGAGRWVLSQSSLIESFFQQTFKRPLPIAVFGQGSIHNQWRLDHRNAMDISLHPDGPEGQALIQYMQSNGIPFSAFRGAIPGVATGPHIHIGLPSHRY
jgi:outer membrane efflux protein